MTKNTKDIASMYGVSPIKMRTWIKLMKLQDAGRDFNNNLLYDSKDYRKIGDCINVTSTGKVRFSVTDEYKNRKDPVVTQGKGEHKGKCEVCGKETATWRRVTCGSKECIYQIRVDRGIIS